MKNDLIADLIFHVVKQLSDEYVDADPQNPVHGTKQAIFRIQVISHLVYLLQ